MQLSSIRPIDCDIHLAVPSTRALVPYLDDYWREHVIRRGIDGDNLELSAYPPNAPLNCRPDWRPQSGLPGSQFEQVRDHVLEPFQPRFAICNVLHGSQIMFSEDLSAALCRAINNWIVAEWLDRDPRLRASIVVPAHSPDLAVAEIERRAADTRFVQVLMLAMTELPLGRRQTLADLRSSREVTACRSAFTPAAASAIRRAPSAGHRITSKTTSRRRPASPAC